MPCLFAAAGGVIGVTNGSVARGGTGVEEVSIALLPKAQKDMPVLGSGHGSCKGKLEE